jgi:hypothetical protein
MPSLRFVLAVATLIAASPLPAEPSKLPTKLPAEAPTVPASIPEAPRNDEDERALIGNLIVREMRERLLWVEPIGHWTQDLERTGPIAPRKAAIANPTLPASASPPAGVRIPLRLSFELRMFLQLHVADPKPETDVFDRNLNIDLTTMPDLPTYEFVWKSEYWGEDPYQPIREARERDKLIAYVDRGCPIIDLHRNSSPGFAYRWRFSEYLSDLVPIGCAILFREHRQRGADAYSFVSVVESLTSAKDHRDAQQQFRLQFDPVRKEWTVVDGPGRPKPWADSLLESDDFLEARMSADADKTPLAGVVLRYRIQTPETEPQSNEPDDQTLRIDFELKFE